MYQMVILVLDELDKTSEVLDAWEAAGITGVTILESTGLGRMRKLAGARDDLPLMPSILRLLRTREEEHRTLFTLVDNEELVDRLIEVTQAITGDLDGPNKGIMFSLPILRAIGVATSS